MQRIEGSKDIGLMFRPEMVRAILSILPKTQTRRLEFHGKVGDHIYVKETFGYGHSRSAFDTPHFVYRADSDPFVEKGFWKSSMFMPKRAARIWLEVTALREERLQDISESDAIAEGCSAGYRKIPGSNISTMMTAIDYFRNLWQTINGKKYPWNSNPKVKVITFKRVYP